MIYAETIILEPKGDILLKAKLIVLDLDGTLLNSKKQLTNRNLDVVSNCYKNGMKILIATARPPRSVQTLLPQELLDISSFVFYNGALIIDDNVKIEEHISIPKEFTSEIIRYCDKYFPSIKISVEVNNKWYANKELTDSSIYNQRFSPQILTVNQLKDLKATKIMITNFEEGEKLQLLFGKQTKFIVTDNGKLIQIMNKNVSKSAGVLKLSSHYGINPSEMIVFGDDYNDMDMFKMSGYSVAMLNGVQELKEVANEIGDSNDNDGVAKVLERMMQD